MTKKKSVKYWLVLPFRKLKNILAIVISFVLLSNRGRRMLLAASLYAHLKSYDSKEPSQDELNTIAHEINELFKLATKSDKALVIPILIHDHIWGDLSIPSAHEMRTTPVTVSCKQILRRVPCWMRYDEKVMGDDISLVIRRFLGRETVVRSAHA